MVCCSSESVRAIEMFKTVSPSSLALRRKIGNGVHGRGTDDAVQEEKKEKDDEKDEKKKKGKKKSKSSQKGGMFEDAFMKGLEGTKIAQLAKNISSKIKPQDFPELDDPMKLMSSSSRLYCLVRSNMVTINSVPLGLSRL